GTEGVSLFEREFGFPDHPLLLLLRVGLRNAPAINTGDGTAQFGEGFLAVIIANEARVAFEVFEIAMMIDLLSECADVRDGRVVSDPIAHQAIRIIAPE